MAGNSITNVTVGVTVDMTQAKAFAALSDVWHERRRQVEELGYTPEHDDKMGDVDRLITEAEQLLKPLTRTSRKGLVQVAALLLASIEMIDRRAQQAEAGK